MAIAWRSSSLFCDDIDPAPETDPRRQRYHFLSHPETGGTGGRVADLLWPGLLRSSFVPPKPVRELRELTSYRRKLVESQSAERNRLLKLLDTAAHVKLASVASDGFAVSGLEMLSALVPWVRIVCLADN
ncbi:MAG: hypothetical protein DMG70_26615 [Acidobacteria bacterium]|nr:MAG: hypothetical protein DMG70_26615 [Acidobacteriota bacterium]PYY05013.1 MAG: hypothetical protein DMG69_28345 [Acidobacteriota bacterium]